MNWFDAQAIIEAFGDWAAVAVAFVIFIETAFIFTSILPGDSLLFLTGLTLANSESWLPDWAGFSAYLDHGFFWDPGGLLDRRENWSALDSQGTQVHFEQGDAQ